MTNEVVMLGSFCPSQFDPDVIDRELRPRLPRCCARQTIGVRIPPSVPVPGNLVWHQDGQGDAAPPQHLIVWASESPTELRVMDGTVLTVQPYEIVWFDNQRVWHRQPTETDVAHRWFLAVRCHGDAR